MNNLSRKNFSIGDPTLSLIILSIASLKNPVILWNINWNCFFNGSAASFKGCLIYISTQVPILSLVSSANSFNGSITCSVMSLKIPPSRFPSLSSLPKKVSLKVSVVVANPMAEPSNKLVPTPKGPATKPAIAPAPILGRTLTTFSLKFFPNKPSSPNNFSRILSFEAANPAAEPRIIPATGPPGTKGRIEVIPPKIAPFPIFGKYLWILLLSSFESNPPLYSPFSSFLPNKPSWIFSLFLMSISPAPTEAPKIGPPITPGRNDTPAPTTAPAPTSGAYFLISVNAVDKKDSLVFSSSPFLGIIPLIQPVRV